MNSKAQNAKQSLGIFKQKVDIVLAEILDREIKEAENYTQLAVEYMTELKNISLVSGKRLRPSFVYYTCLLYTSRCV